MESKKIEGKRPLFFDGLPADVKGSSFLLLFSGDKLLVKKMGDGYDYVKVSEISETADHTKGGTVHFLGTEGGDDYYCLRARGPVEIKKDGFEFRDLRSLMNAIEWRRFTHACVASQILYWDASNAFCGECGGRTKYSASERAKTCPECSRNFYPAISPAIIVAVMNGNKILLAHNKSFADGVYSLIAGFVEPGESLEECVKREVLEETGITVKDVKYFKSQPWPFPSSMMIGFTAVYESDDIKPDGVEITDAAWFGREKLPFLPRPGSLSRGMIDVLMG